MTERNTVFFLGVLILLVLSAPNLKAEFLPNFGILRFSFVHNRIMFLLPVLGLLGWLTSAGDRTDRQKSGWKLPGILDIAAVPVLVTLTLLLGLVFSQG